MGVHLARAVLGIMDSVTVAQAGIVLGTARRAGRGHLRVMLCLVALAGLMLAMTVWLGLGWYAGIGAGFALGYWAAHREHGTDSPRAEQTASGDLPRDR